MAHRDDHEASRLRGEALERDLEEARARAERAERAMREAQDAARRVARGVVPAADGRVFLARHDGPAASVHPAVARLAEQASEHLGAVRSAELLGDPTMTTERRAARSRTSLVVAPVALGVLPGGLLGAIVGRVATDLAALRGPLGGLVLGAFGLAFAIAGALLVRQLLLRTGHAPRATVLCADGVADWLLAPRLLSGTPAPPRLVRFADIARVRRTRWERYAPRRPRAHRGHMFRLELLDADGRSRFEVTGVDLPPGLRLDAEYRPWAFARLLEEEMKRRNTPQT